jgi:hypothetical protein
MMLHAYTTITTATTLTLLLSAFYPSLSTAFTSGLQSGPDAKPTFSGGMVYDATSHAIYITGATYGTFSGTVKAGDLASSSCFLATISLPATPNNNEQLQWIHRQTFGTTNVPEACSSLAISSEATRRSAYVMATTEDGGLLTDLSQTTGKGENGRPKQFGSVLNLDLASNGDGTLLGGMVMDDEPVQYPMAIVADPSHQYLYVLSLFSSETTDNPDFNKFGVQEFPNLTTGALRKFGTTYRMLLERIKVEHKASATADELEEDLTPTWRLPLGTTGGTDSIWASSMVQVNSQLLIVVGSTRGEGTAVGGESLGDRTDMDGFITKFNPNTGGYVNEGTNAKQSARFGASGQEDWISNVCVGAGDEEFIYVVGATEGLLDTTSNSGNIPDDVNIDAFVSKINIVTLIPVWTKQFHASNPNGAKAAAYALTCKVSDDGSIVYVAGVVENGGALDYPIEQQKAAGKNDIFIVQLNPDNGDINWLHQIGTPGKDSLAHGGGLAIDKNDNAILFGDTTGAFYRSRDKDVNQEMTDIFVLTVEKTDGAYQVPTEFSGIENTGGDAAPVENNQVTAPNGGDNFVQDSEEDDEVLDDDGGWDDDDEYQDDDIEYEDDNSSRNTFIVVSVLCLVSLFVIFCFVGRSNRNKEIATERAHVFSYLQAFDVEDVDLRHSATGGWHGTYVNRLANGINKGEESSLHGVPQSYVFETAPLTHSSIVTDSLFMDVDTKPSLGASSGSDDEEESMGSGSRGYDGLVSAYGDLQPRSYSDRKANLEGKPWGREII